VYSLIPIIVEQIITLTQNIGKVVNNILADKNFEFPFSKELKPFYDGFVKNIDKQQLISELQKTLSTISTQLANIAGNSLSALGAVFNGILNAFIVLVITFFMVIDKKAINGFFRSLIPARYAPYFTIKTRQMQDKIGGWVRGQFLLCLTIGILTYIGLFILQWFGIDIQYKETLAVVAGVTEIIPFIGPVIGAIPAVLIATNISGWAILWVILLYFIIQTLENNIIVNMVMNKEVGLNPIIIMVSMMIGAQFFGVLGVLLAIPVATSISVLVEDYLEKEKD
jgi:predicted PurR-regulated permease PerM